MFKKMFLIILVPFSLLSGAENERLIKVNGIGKIAVKANVADVRIGIEADAKSAQEVEQALSGKLPDLLSSLKNDQVEKLETGMVEIHPEYAANSQIRSFKGRVIISFSAPVEIAGKLITKAFAAGANVLNQVRVRAADATIEEARAIVLREASQNALKEAELVLSNLNLTKEQIRTITIQPSDAGIPIYRNMEFAMLSKASADMQILEGEQIVQAQIEMSISFN